MACPNQISHEIIDSAEESFEASQAEFSEAEIDLIVRIYNLIGERWSLIAGRIPGRTAEEIEKYWKSKHASSA
ncbi:Transcription factor CPC [Dendrobium catenatum]|uniref:Transcription factor CPC n=1 Tax=Dendrobium catenatum TaxID=906689 RepID=A0A2I0VRS2_9ASPA|nr:Transcription factor CPC [Dendrobium catenatum]